MSENPTNAGELTHIVGTFLIQAEGAFLNGAGVVKGENRNVTVPKTLSDFKDKVPYVSSQAWKRWLRNTFQDEYPDEPAAIMKQQGKNARGNTDKVGTDMDPVHFAEDDIFGYMRAQQGQGRSLNTDVGLDAEVEDETEVPEETRPAPKGEKVLAVMRPAPFSASILMSLRKNGWEGIDEGYVHLQEGTPLPYTTRFYNTHLQGIFGLNYERLGQFRNEGDRIELDPQLVTKYARKLTKRENRSIYVLNENPRRKRATRILKSLAVLRKPAKEAQFATDIAPKVIIVAGISSGNLIFNDLFEDTKEGPMLRIAMLKEVVTDYADRLVTRVFVGIRTGYLNPENEAQLRKEFTVSATPNTHDPAEGSAKPVLPIQIVTPIQAIDLLTKQLPQ